MNTFNSEMNGNVLNVAVYTLEHYAISFVAVLSKVNESNHKVSTFEVNKYSGSVDFSKPLLTSKFTNLEEAAEAFRNVGTSLTDEALSEFEEESRE